MKKILLFIFCFVFLFFTKPGFAASNFITDYSVTYNVLENATAHVTFDITLTNKTTQYYASSYNVQVGFENIKNVTVKDSAGDIIPQITKNDNGNNIGIDFNDKIVGLDKKLNFKISFDTPNIALKSGEIWDINIPGLAEQDNYNTFNVKVVVPKSIGKPSYVKPDTGTMVDNNLVFTKEELGESGISIAYGEEQIYDFNLLYHLENNNVFPIKTEIALPMQTNYQDVQISEINPEPQNVTIDDDGNWLAQYTLTAGKKMNITVTGHSRITMNPKKQLQTEEELKEYLKEQPYWQTNDIEIKKLALKLKTPQAIFKYVVDHLTYDFNRVENSESRLGAAEVLQKPHSAVCLEFTDLFITLARAANIPAREVNGFAYTQNTKERPVSLIKDVLHAWPEYYDYDLQAWIMVDPTWTNTTGGVDYFHRLDFDHFAFVIRGIDSNYPVPAGGYKTEDDQNSKDIDIKLGNDYPFQAQTFSISESFANDYLSILAPQGEIIIKNVGSIISLPQEVQVTTNVLEPTSQKISLGKIPPFGFVKLPVRFERPPLLTNKEDVIKIAINENYISKDIKISPFILNRWTIAGGLILASIIITISLIAYKIGGLSFFKRKG